MGVGTAAWPWSRMYLILIKINTQCINRKTTSFDAIKMLKKRRKNKIPDYGHYPLATGGEVHFFFNFLFFF